jgi:hypothetical protein
MKPNAPERRAPSGADKKPGSHGNHWGCVTQSTDEIIRSVEWALKEAKNPEIRAWNGREVAAYVPESRSLTTCAITLDRSVSTGYPMALDGIVHEVTVDHIEEWANGLEGQVVGSVGDAALAFFDTGYYRNIGRYREGDSRLFALAACAYVLHKAEPRTITNAEAKEHSTRNLAAYRPFPQGDIDDFVYQSPVKSVETVSFCGKTVYRLLVPLFRLPDESGEYRDIDITLYAAGHVTGGYAPRVGDDVMGILWLQGSLSPG